MRRNEDVFLRLGNGVFWTAGVLFALAIFIGSLNPGSSVYGARMMWALLAWGVVGRVAESIRLSRAHEMMNRSEFHDAGTGTLSNAGLVNAIEREMRLSKRKGGELSIVVIEALNIIAINRNFDRAEGDGALEAIVMASQKCLRDTDYLGRASGLVFCAILPDSDESAAKGAMTRINESLSSILRSHPKGEVRVEYSTAAKTWNKSETAVDFLARAQQGLVTN